MSPVPRAMDSHSTPENRLFAFRWRTPDGRQTVLECYARTEEEAEDSARRAGWPGHDGTRLGKYRAWLKESVLRDRDVEPPDLKGEPAAID